MLNSIAKYIQGNMEGDQEGPPFYIITGGPGVGKSSILEALKKMTYHTVAEAATDIIFAKKREGIEKPWESEDFEKEIIDLQTARYERIAHLTTLVFFDRAPIDPLTYQLRANTTPHSVVIKAVQEIIDKKLYNKTVFLVDNLGFCETTAARVETNQESLQIGNSLETAYKALGFKIVHIPNFPDLGKKEAINKRARLILQYCGVEEVMWFNLIPLKSTSQETLCLVYTRST